MEKPIVSYFPFSAARALRGAPPCRVQGLRTAWPYGRIRGRVLLAHASWGLDNELLVADTSYMGRTKRSVEVAYLDPDKHALLKRLAAGTRIPKTVLVREAIDDLLVKYGVLKTPKRKFPSPDSTETR